MVHAFIGITLDWQSVLTHLLQHSPSHRDKLTEYCIRDGTTLTEWYHRCHQPDYSTTARSLLHTFLQQYPQVEQLELIPLTTASYILGLPLPPEIEVDRLTTQLPQAQVLFTTAGFTGILRLYIV